MPETPELEQLEIAIPQDAVPLRQGEDRFAAAVNLEHQRRRESMLSEQLSRMKDTAQGELHRLSRSPSARKRQRQVMNKIAELRRLTRQYDDDTWDGPCAPATIINFNPVALKLDGQLQRMTLAAAGKGARIEVGFRGRKFVGSYMTITMPEVWLKHTGIELDPIADTPSMEARYIEPIGLAHQFYEHYSVGAADAQNMGGIIAFEGSTHVLDKYRLEKRKKMIRVPVSNWAEDGSGEFVYSCEDRNLEDYLAVEFDRQRAYCEAVISQAHSLATSSETDIKNQLHNVHRIWHNYALQMGYIKQSYPWASEKLQDSPLNKAVFCPDCRTQQEDPEQYFCRNCNSPFDAHKAFMDGKQVSPDRLAIYDENSEEFKDILKEIERRKKRMVLLGYDTEAPKRAKAKE